MNEQIRHHIANNALRKSLEAHFNASQVGWIDCFAVVYEQVTTIDKLTSHSGLQWKIALSRAVFAGG